MPVGGNHGRRPPNPHHVPKSHGKKPSTPPSRTGKPSDACCPMVASVRAARQGRFRAARLYARLSVRSIAARMA